MYEVQFYFLLPLSSNQPLKSLKKMICNFLPDKECSGFLIHMHLTVAFHEYN